MVGAIGVISRMCGSLCAYGYGGLHISRNKVPFFSGALFITLAVFVHLTPYFPSLFYFVTSVSSSLSSISVNVVVDGRDSCVSLLHEIDWEVKPSRVFHPSNNNSMNYEKFWSSRRFSSVGSCEFQKLKRHDVMDLLNGSWVMVAGDSQARIFALSLLSLVLDSERLESVRGSLVKRHSNYHAVVDEMGMKLDFIWAPYTTNLTNLVMDFEETRVYPELLVMGSGLWHMLHITNALDYGDSLRFLTSSLTSLLPIMLTLVNSMLNTPEKREKMTNLMCGEYERSLHDSNMLRQFGGPFHLVDIGSLCWSCGIRCTEDGMHYDGVVYEAGVHIMLNALLIESHQKL